LVAITNQLRLRSLGNRLTSAQLQAGLISVAQAAAAFWLAKQQGLWPWALVVVLMVELWGIWRRDGAGRGKLVMNRLQALLVGASVVLIIAVAPRLATQVTVAVLYGGWRWWTRQSSAGRNGLANLLAVQAVVLEALFLMAAVWRTEEWLVLVLAWVSSYVLVYGVLSGRGERSAGVMAATWALITVEVSWVLLRWLFVYTVTGGYLLVPQPALILTAIAYCFGSIYQSQRQGNLSRARLVEYLLIGLILIMIVITGTPWRGTL
jgi:hypothetical protein